VNTPASICTPAELTAFKRRLTKVDPVLANLIRVAGKFTHTTSAQHSPFHSLARAIAHQQLNGTAAESIFGRFVGLYAVDGMNAAMLEARMVLDTPDDKMRAVGLSFAKIASIKDLAQKTLDGVVPPSEILHTLGDDEIVERITQVRGIGRWTVEMMLMSRLGRPDVLPSMTLACAMAFASRTDCEACPLRAHSRNSVRAGRPIARWRRGICGARWICIARANYPPRPRQPVSRL